ncbi:hypothetical protein DACRYDRAFT_103597 [Dacryopinax primogenitus]|uniref:Uncharacterized protein n=1 Tax=Dacryopinax primogenitus (strain DJM 731) TaxID=1858805 RepID=M5GD80_DACPD|nr:uncharacterized protein DACRYDRAFT_103597 [Dacryopinax primogenitus]EJU06650.1 hypothetical protein DACRYDRAFT_103597 [Dacryopinax primogenitus]
MDAVIKRWNKNSKTMSSNFELVKGDMEQLEVAFNSDLESVHAKLYKLRREMEKVKTSLTSEQLQACSIVQKKLCLALNAIISYDSEMKGTPVPGKNGFKPNVPEDGEPYVLINWDTPAWNKGTNKAIVDKIDDLVMSKHKSAKSLSRQQGSGVDLMTKTYLQYRYLWMILRDQV